jgi:hypothetical protein
MSRPSGRTRLLRVAVSVSVLLTGCAPSVESRGASMPRLARRIVLTEDGTATPRGRIDHLAFDPATRRLFVACVEAGALAVVELEGATPVRLLGGLPGPQGVAVVPGSKGPSTRVFVACSGDGKVHAFDTASLLEMGSVFAGAEADNVRFDARSRRLLVGCRSEQGGAIVAIDPDTLAVTGRTLLPAHAAGFPARPRQLAHVRQRPRRQGSRGQRQRAGRRP